MTSGGASRAAVLAVAAWAALGPGFACAPIEGRPLSEAPVNSCQRFPCDQYDVQGSARKVQCSQADRCDLGPPEYDFNIVVDVPSTSFYAPGRTFVLRSTAVSAQPGITVRGKCSPPLCVQLPASVPVEGRYRVKKAVSDAFGLALPDNASIPVRVEYVPLGPGGSAEEAAKLGFPLASVQMSSRLIREAEDDPGEVLYRDTLSVGRYLRVQYPQPPYDEVFPPAITSALRVSGGLLDEFILGAEQTPLDDALGTSRLSNVSRPDEGLDRWRVWLEDETTARRISSVHTLSGMKMTVRLDTVGQNRPETTAASIRDKVEVVLAPPDDWIGVPRYQARLVQGTGHESLKFPRLPPPASVSGVVGQGEGAVLTGIPARLVFSSTSAGLRVEGEITPVVAHLKYTTVVSTDDKGRFATVLPPGFYDVIVEPAEGTGFSKVRDTLDTGTTPSKTFRPPPRTIATGRAVLADGRPLAEAEVLAVPSEKPVTGTAVKPRPARARTDRDGNFRLDLDQGQYDLAVEPQVGSGFPNVVQIRSFSSGTADIGAITVSPPALLSFALQDPSGNGNPIVRAMVRVFAEAPGRGPPAVEIGRAMTNDVGQCEILLAHQPR